MNNQYVFIIWNKALFAKDRIINDLNDSFEIEKLFYIEWSKNKFEDNLLALYGEKCNNPKEKAFAVGRRKFLVLIVKDNNPIFEDRQQHKLVKVNSGIYDKKWLYRRWTAGNFRIHASVTDEETRHDLSILLGNNYEIILDRVINDEILKIDAVDNLLIDIKH